MKKTIERAHKVDNSDNHILSKINQPEVDKEILLQRKKRKAENDALKKMIANLHQLQDKNKSSKKNNN